jgi:hypothetical protein
MSDNRQYWRGFGKFREDQLWPPDLRLSRQYVYWGRLGGLPSSNLTVTL